jgi:integrase
LPKRSGPRFRCLVLLAGFGGLRVGEAIGLRRRHVDLGAATVRVEEQVVTIGQGTRLVTDPKSEAGVRTVALPRVVVGALSEHLTTAVGPEPDALLFPAERGGLLPVTTLYKAWRAAREAVGYPQLHLHDLRHLAGAMAAWTGATQRELMSRMGQASPAASLRYQHAAQVRDQAIAAGLDAILARWQIVPRDKNAIEAEREETPDPSVERFRR